MLGWLLRIMEADLPKSGKLSQRSQVSCGAVSWVQSAPGLIQPVRARGEGVLWCITWTRSALLVLHNNKCLIAESMAAVC
jgi:hypothetical protein